MSLDSSSLFTTFFDLMIEGGAFMWPLLAGSIIDLTIIILKIVQIQRVQLGQVGFVKPITQAVARGHYFQAIDKLRQSLHPVARAMGEAIIAGQDITLQEEARERLVNRVGILEIRKLQSYLRGLEIVANLSPLIGFLGTIIGIMNTFAAQEAVITNVNPGPLADGIWQPLLTTAFGLLIAISALGALYWFEGRIERTRRLMQDATVEILDHFDQLNPHTRSEAPRSADSFTASGAIDRSLVKA